MNDLDTITAELRKADFCQRCLTERELRFCRQSGKVLTTLPVHCDDKPRCEAEMWALAKMGQSPARSGHD